MSESRPGASVHEVRAAEGDMAGQLRTLLCFRCLQKQNRRPGRGWGRHRYNITLKILIWDERKLTVSLCQDACTGADGVRIAGRRIRVSHALPRNKGPRNRFVTDRRGDGECHTLLLELQTIHRFSTWLKSDSENTLI